jgi:hypothetical protein
LSRYPDTVRLTHAPNFQLVDLPDELRGMSAQEVHAYIRDRGALYGTASSIGKTIEAFCDAGCRGFMVFCNAVADAKAWSN